MDIPIDHNELDTALKQCGSDWNCAQSHGLLCGRLAVLGTDGARTWLEQILGDQSTADAEYADCVQMLDRVFQSTWQQLAERQSEFELLLPGDDEEMAFKAESIGFWCEGFLHGLVSGKHGDALKKRLAAEPLADLIKDMLEITRVSFDEADDEESSESSYTELVEYVRVAVQLAYEELAELRATGNKNTLSAAVSDALH
jgi:yecA family protein